MATDFVSIPSTRTGTQLRTRNIFSNFSSAQKQTQGALQQISTSLSADPTNTPSSLLQAGLLMGKITTGGNYRPSVIGLTTGAAASGDGTITVAAATATEVARLIALAGTAVSLKVIGPPTTAGTVAIISVSISAASGTTLTIASSGTIGTAAASGSLITPADGSQNPVTIIGNPDGIEMAVTGGTWSTVASSNTQFLDPFYRGGSVFAAQIINLTTCDASCQTWLKQVLNGAITPTAASPTHGLWTFDNDI